MCRFCLLQQFFENPIKKSYPIFKIDTFNTVQQSKINYMKKNLNTNGCFEYNQTMIYLIATQANIKNEDVV